MVWLKSRRNGSDEFLVCESVRSSEAAFDRHLAVSFSVKRSKPKPASGVGLWDRAFEKAFSHRLLVPFCHPHPRSVFGRAFIRHR